MAITMPRTVIEALGEEAAADFAHWFETILRERTVSRDEHHQILSRLDVLERVVSDLVVEVRELRREMDERFDRVNERFDRMSERFDRMYERMLVMTRWTVGTLALFGTAITILLAISQFVR
jgi:tetrahydromethanopterin S-methyltransferase subunit G